MTPILDIALLAALIVVLSSENPAVVGEPLETNALTAKMERGV